MPLAQARKEVQKRLNMEITKTIAAFLNTGGGTLLVGVDDSDAVLGIEPDFGYCQRGKQNADGWLLSLKQVVINALGPEVWSAVQVSLICQDQKTVAVVHCPARTSETWHNVDGERLYIRASNATEELTGPSLVRYIRERWPASKPVRSGSSPARSATCGLIGAWRRPAATMCRACLPDPGGSPRVPLRNIVLRSELLKAPHVSRAHRFLVVLVLNLALVAGLLTVAVTAHSPAVLAEGGDYLLNAVGVAVALLALRLSARPASRERLPGHPDATGIAALVNGGWLLVLELIVASAATDRLIAGTRPVEGLPVLVVSGIAAVAMTAGALILRGDGTDGEGERDLSVAAVLLDTVADAAAAAGVATARRGNPVHRRLVLARPRGCARHRRRGRLPRARTDQEGNQSASA